MSQLHAVMCGRGLILRCCRELSGETGSLLEQMACVRSDQTRFVVLDLSRSQYADSEGLRWLLRFGSALEAQGLELRVVVREKSSIQRALSLTGYDRLLGLYPTPRGAWHVGTGTLQ